MTEVKANPLKVVADIFALDLKSCDVAVCLASLQQDAAIPLYMALELSKTLTGSFRDVVISVVQEYKKLEQKRNLVLREYAVETKPDDYEIEYLDLSNSEYENISKQIKPILSFQDMGTFQEEKWFVSNLRFYVIKVTSLKGESIYFYRAYTPKKY